jgi:hypothetical protein
LIVANFISLYRSACLTTPCSMLLDGIRREATWPLVATRVFLKSLSLNQEKDREAVTSV